MVTGLAPSVQVIVAVPSQGLTSRPLPRPTAPPCCHSRQKIYCHYPDMAKTTTAWCDGVMGADVGRTCQPRQRNATRGVWDGDNHRHTHCHAVPSTKYPVRVPPFSCDALLYDTEREAAMRSTHAPATRRHGGGSHAPGTHTALTKRGRARNGQPTHTRGSRYDSTHAPPFHEQIHTNAMIVAGNTGGTQRCTRPTSESQPPVARCRPSAENSRHDTESADDGNASSASPNNACTIQHS